MSIAWQNETCFREKSRMISLGLKWQKTQCSNYLKWKKCISSGNWKSGDGSDLQTGLIGDPHDVMRILGCMFWDYRWRPPAASGFPLFQQSSKVLHKCILSLGPSLDRLVWPRSPACPDWIAWAMCITPRVREQHNFSWRGSIDWWQVRNGSLQM